MKYYLKQDGADQESSHETGASIRGQFSAHYLLALANSSAGRLFCVDVGSCFAVRFH